MGIDFDADKIIIPVCPMSVEMLLQMAGRSGRKMDSVGECIIVTNQFSRNMVNNLRKVKDNSEEFKFLNEIKTILSNTDNCIVNQLRFIMHGSGGTCNALFKHELCSVCVTKNQNQGQQTVSQRISNQVRARVANSNNSGNPFSFTTRSRQSSGMSIASELTLTGTPNQSPRLPTVSPFMNPPAASFHTLISTNAVQQPSQSM